MENLQFKHYREKNVTIVAVSGSINSTNVSQLKKFLDPVLSEMDSNPTFNSLALDLNSVPTMDSSGIGLVCGKFVRLKKQHKKLVLCNVSRTVQDMFGISGLGNTIPFYKNVIQAIGDLSAPDFVDKEAPSQSSQTSATPQKKGKGLQDFMDPKRRNF